MKITPHAAVSAILLGAVLSAGAGLIHACGFDQTLRAYLDVHFWLPFSRDAVFFEKSNVQRVSEPYAGMVKAAVSGEGATPLARLRTEYQKIAQPVSVPFDPSGIRQFVAAARSVASISSRDREEIDLIDAKIDMRAGQPGAPELLFSARNKLEKLIGAAQTPEFQSEARGWLARVHYLLGDQTAAGKLYLDELNRSGSNLSRETLFTSLRQTYGYDGGADLLNHIDEYFDTPEHAAFAIQMATNPHWDINWDRSRLYDYPAGERTDSLNKDAQYYARILKLLDSNRKLLESNSGAESLALLAMRTSLRMGDPAGAIRVAAMVPAKSEVRAEPDFDWMLASSQFVSRNYAAAEAPLRRLFANKQSSDAQKAAAAYGLCGVYQKTRDVLEQIRYALWLHGGLYVFDSAVEDHSVYWAASGWDLNLLLETESTLEALQAFAAKYPKADGIRLVQYAIAVRIARDNRYDESAAVYDSIRAPTRAKRMLQLALLYKEANRTDLPPSQLLEAKYKLAEFIGANSERIYFNDSLWEMRQRYALTSSEDNHLTRAERQRMIAGERKLQDDQEERWRAYMILRDIVREAGKTDLGRKAATLALRDLRGISERFGRKDEIRKADIELSRWLLLPKGEGGDHR